MLVARCTLGINKARKQKGSTSGHGASFRELAARAILIFQSAIAVPRLVQRLFEGKKNRFLYLVLWLFGPMAKKKVNDVTANFTESELGLITHLEHGYCKDLIPGKWPHCAGRAEPIPRLLM